jgi:hypothetical protein
MCLEKKSVLLLIITGLLFLSLGSAQASMVSTADIVSQKEQRAQLVNMLKREDVKNQLMEMGVDYTSARERVEQMTDKELDELNGKLADLPAGAGVSTTNLLLIIILLILLL